MSEKAFSKIMRGLQEAKAYMEGKVTVPPSVDVKSIRKGLHMTQAAFSNSFGFSLDAVKHWEGDGGRPRCRPGLISPSSSATRRLCWKRYTWPQRPPSRKRLRSVQKRRSRSPDMSFRRSPRQKESP
jgi:hypothetical protein